MEHTIRVIVNSASDGIKKVGKKDEETRDSSKATTDDDTTSSAEEEKDSRKKTIDELKSGKDKSKGFLSGIFKAAKPTADEVLDDVKDIADEVEEESLKAEPKIEKNLLMKVKILVNTPQRSFLQKPKMH